MAVRGIPGAWLVLMAAVCWGTTGTAQSFAPDGATPLAVGTARIVIGGAALLAWAVARRAFQPGARWPVGTTLVAAVCMAAYQLCFFAAVRRTGVAVGTVVAIGSGPVIAGLLSWLFYRTRSGRVWLASTLLAISGCVVLGLNAGGVVLDLAGLALAVGAGGSYALYTLMSKELVAAQRPEAAMSVVFGLGALMLLPVGLVQDFRWLAQPSGLAVALHLGIVTTAVAYALFARGLQTTTVAHAVTLTLGEPLTAATLGIVLLREPVTGPVLVGMGLVFAGLALLALGARRRAVPAVADGIVG